MDEASESLRFEDRVAHARRKRPVNKAVDCASVIILILSVIVLTVGVVLIVKSTGRDKSSTPEDHCSWSSGESGERLREFLFKTQRVFFELHPHRVYRDPERKRQTGSSSGSNNVPYKPFNPKPSVLKTITDTSRKLYAQLSELNIDPDALKPRERKALVQTKHSLQHTFDQPYGVNYYAGDWMMGPNSFCWEPICALTDDIHNHLKNFRPHDLKQLKTLRETLKGQAEGIDQYIRNMKEGVKVGMVRSVQECRAGIDAIRLKFLNISLHGEKGVLQSKFVRRALKPKFTSGLSKKDQYGWLKETSLSVKQTIRRDMVEFIGKPIVRLLRYLENDHIRHCVPSSVSSGFASLPLAYEYLDQKRTNTKTSKILPTGEPLNGTKSYETIMSFFTTTNITPGEVDKLGHEQLKLLYPQVLEIARNLTGITGNDTKAVASFRQLQRSREHQFNPDPFPENESNAEAYKRCTSTEAAKRFCPKRWEATQKYWNEARMVITLLNSKIVPLFYFGGSKTTVPLCPVELIPVFNPSIASESYLQSDQNCTKSALYHTPFFTDNFRPRYEVWSIAAHEASPGHHTQLQGRVEYFQDDCSDIASWIDGQTYYPSFSEGWGLYAEDPLSTDTGIYDNTPMYKYGMLKAQIWRALRLIIDTGLHYRGLTRDEALSLFDKYTWDNSDIMKKEVTRYQSVPGQATAYTIGKLHIEELREYAKKRLGEKFSLKEFHYQLLSQGSAPHAYLASHIHKFVDCTLNEAKDDCKIITTGQQFKTGRNTDRGGNKRQLERRTRMFDQMHYY